MKSDSYIILRPGEYELLSEKLQKRFDEEASDKLTVEQGVKYYFEHSIFHEIVDEAVEEGWEDYGSGDE